MYFDPAQASSNDKIELYKVAMRVKNSLSCSWMTLLNDYADLGVKEKYEDNLRKGRGSAEKVGKLHSYIAKNHLHIGVEYAPHMFDPSMLSNWENFLQQHGVWNKVNVRPLGDMGLTAQSDQKPISRTHIALGQDYCFTLDSQRDASLIAFEEYHNQWYAMPLGVSGKGLITGITKGMQDVPLHPDTQTVIPLRDDEHSGRHGYAFIIGEPGMIGKIQHHVPNKHALKDDYLKKIVHECEKHPGQTDVARLNVIFK